MCIPSRWKLVCLSGFHFFGVSLWTSLSSIILCLLAINTIYLQDYLLKDTEEKVVVGTEAGDKSAEKDDVVAAPEASVTADPVDSPVESSDTSVTSESVPDAVDSSQGSDAAAVEENVVNSDKDVPVADNEESSENADEGNTDEEKPEIKVSSIKPECDY